MKMTRTCVCVCDGIFLLLHTHTCVRALRGRIIHGSCPWYLHRWWAEGGHLGPTGASGPKSHFLSRAGWHQGEGGQGTQEEARRQGQQKWRAGLERAPGAG